MSKHYNINFNTGRVIDPTLGAQQAISNIGDIMKHGQEISDKKAAEAESMRRFNLQNDRAQAEADRNQAIYDEKLKQQAIVTDVNKAIPNMSSVQLQLKSTRDNILKDINTRYKDATTDEEIAAKNAAISDVNAKYTALSTSKDAQKIYDANALATRARQEAYNAGASVDTANGIYKSTLDNYKQADLTERQKLDIQTRLGAAKETLDNGFKVFNEKTGTTQHIVGDVGSSGSSRDKSTGKQYGTGAIAGTINSMVEAIDGNSTPRSSVLDADNIGDTIKNYGLHGIKIVDAKSGKDTGKTYIPSANDFKLAAETAMEHGNWVFDDAYSKKKFNDTLLDMAANPSHRAPSDYSPATQRNLTTTSSNVYHKNREAGINSVNKVYRDEIADIRKEFKAREKPEDVVARLWGDYTTKFKAGTHAKPTPVEVKTAVSKVTKPSQQSRVLFSDSDNNPLSYAMNSSEPGQVVALASESPDAFKGYMKDYSKAQKKAVTDYLAKPTNVAALNTLIAANSAAASNTGSVATNNINSISVNNNLANTPKVDPNVVRYDKLQKQLANTPKTITKNGHGRSVVVTNPAYTKIQEEFRKASPKYLNAKAKLDKTPKNITVSRNGHKYTITNPEYTKLQAELNPNEFSFSNFF